MRLHIFGLAFCSFLEARSLRVENDGIASRQNFSTISSHFLELQISGICSIGAHAKTVGGPSRNITYPLALVHNEMRYRTTVNIMAI